MTQVLRFPLPVLGCLLAATLSAQQPEPATLGLQVRVSQPQAGLHDAAGGGDPGLGVSLVMEQDLAEYFEGWRGRVELGGDSWFWGDLTKLPGSSNRVNAVHAGVELVRMLRPGGDPVALGPYMVLGVGVYQWSYPKTDPATGTRSDVRVGHPAGTFGFGWRVTRSLDAEVKVLAGKLDPDATAMALVVGATWRF